MTEKRTQAAEMVDLARPDVRLFHTPDATPYVALPVDVHDEVWPLRSTAVRSWLGKRYWQENGKPAGGQALTDAINVLAGVALFEGPTETVHVRVAGDDRTIWLDLADRGWRAIRITAAAGWEIVERPPVRFVRGTSSESLPEPVAGGSLDELRPFTNVRDEDQWRLLVGYLLGALRPSGPYAVLVVTGEQDAAKSTTARTVRRVIDPSRLRDRAQPRHEHDLAIAAARAWVVAFDNMAPSGIPDWVSDALARLSTGAGFAARRLWTDDDEAVFYASRPLIVNGIGSVVSRGDLLSRAIILDLPRIEPARRREEAEFWPAFDAAHPRILGALLDAACASIGGWPTATGRGAPRMADLTRFVNGAEPALGWPRGSFLDAYRANAAAAHELALDASPIVPPLRELAAAGSWEGTAADLLDRLATIAGEATTKRRTWPDGPKALSADLARLAPDLRSIGIEVSRRRSHGVRLIMISTIVQDSGTSGTRGTHEHDQGAAGAAGAASDAASQGRTNGHDLRSDAEQIFGTMGFDWQDGADAPWSSDDPGAAAEART